MGGDSAACVNNVVHISEGGKVFTQGEYVLGYCGIHRLGDILRYRFNPASPTDDIETFMRTAFVDTLRQTFTDAGYLETQNGRAQFEGRILIGVRGLLFYMDAYFAIHRPEGGYMAIGCAEEAALTALDLLCDVEPEARARQALSAAARRVDGVRPPFLIEKI
jgi:hypothetical protein